MVTRESKNASESGCMLNVKGVSMPDICLKRVWAVASEIEDSS